MSRRVLFLIALGACALSVTPLRAADAPKKEVPKPPSKEVAEAWKKALAKVGWIEVTRWGEFTFHPAEESPQAGWLMGFQKDGGNVKGLPAPEGEFALDLGFGGTTDEHVKELAAFPRLTALGLRGSGLTEAGVKTVAGLKQLTALRIRSLNVTVVGLKELAALQQLRALDIEGGKKVTAAGLKELTVLKQLTTLGLSYTQTTDEGVQALVALKQLTALNLRDTAITSASVKAVAGLNRLAALDLGGNERITDACLKELAALKHLETLNLCRCYSLTGAAAKEVAAFGQLTALDLGATKLDDDGVKELVALKRLTSLGIRYTDVTNDSMKEVAKLTALTALDLSDCPNLTNSGFKELAALKNLTRLNLHYTNLTDPGVKALVGLDRLTHLNVGQTGVYIYTCALKFRGTQPQSGWNVEEMSRRTPPARAAGGAHNGAAGGAHTPPTHRPCGRGSPGLWLPHPPPLRAGFACRSPFVNVLPPCILHLITPTGPAPSHNGIPTMPRKVYIETVGCQMNVLDSELVIGALRRRGYDLTDTPADADVLLFNTCSVREHAEEKTFSALGRVRLLKRDNPDAVIGVLGCMAQKDQELIRKRAPYVDMVVGTGQLAEVPALVEKVRATREPQLAVSLGRADAGRHEVEASFISYDPARDPSMRPTPFQAYVRIQIGCDKFCTYCVVPSTRGPEQSRPPEHIWSEVRQLVDQGCKEVTLLGQTVNSYVYAHGDRRTRFSDLIAGMHDTAGLERIKFVTNYPKDMTDDLLDAVRELPKVVKYLHVPVQSGCDEVLRRMKRNYTAGYYMEMLSRCRERVPDVSVSSDFIVGFCGETEESFQKSMDLVREAKFKNSFIFKYSERSGTKAAERYPDDVPDEVKKRRNNDLLAVQNENSRIDHRAQVGKTVEVLVEGPSRREQSASHQASRDREGHAMQLTGRSMADHIVVFDGTARLIGHTVRIAITDASPFTLYGSVLTDEVIGANPDRKVGGEPSAAPRRDRFSLPLV